jgi:hypothetical protein
VAALSDRAERDNPRSRTTSRYSPLAPPPSIPAIAFNPRSAPQAVSATATKESPARFEVPDAQLTFRLRFSPGRRQMGRASRAGDVVGLRHKQRRRGRARCRRFPRRACSRTGSPLAISPACRPRERRTASREAAQHCPPHRRMQGGDRSVQNPPAAYAELVWPPWRRGSAGQFENLVHERSERRLCDRGPRTTRSVKAIAVVAPAGRPSS